jgi:hypothetical protein
MSLIALITWITAAAGGLYLLSIWLIEYDKEFQSTAATRLPPAVLISHATLAGGGLIIWAGYLVFDIDNLVWVSALVLLVAATLGSFMASRWVGVYRETRHIRLAAAEQEAVMSSGGTSRHVATLTRPARIGPPERNFPLPVVIAHGGFAFATIAMVLLIAFGVGGS